MSGAEGRCAIGLLLTALKYDHTQFMSRGLERAAYDLDEYLIFSDIRPKRLNERFPACSSGYRPRAGEPEFLYGALARQDVCRGRAGGRGPETLMREG